jgi:hypothetical protein
MSDSCVKTYVRACCSKLLGGKSPGYLDYYTCYSYYVDGQILANVPESLRSAVL